MGRKPTLVGGKVTQSQIVPVVTVFLVLEAVNVAVNILPARRQTSETARRPYLIRAGVFNLIVIAAIAAYIVLHR